MWRERSSRKRARTSVVELPLFSAVAFCRCYMPIASPSISARVAVSGRTKSSGLRVSITYKYRAAFICECPYKYVRLMDGCTSAARHGRSAVKEANEMLINVALQLELVPMNRFLMPEQPLVSIDSSDGSRRCNTCAAGMCSGHAAHTRPTVVMV
jgi:plasmid stability protein